MVFRLKNWMKNCKNWIMEEQIKKYLKENLHIFADFEESETRLPEHNKLVISISLGRDVISKTSVWVKANWPWIKKYCYG